MKVKLTKTQENFIIQEFKKGKGRVTITKNFNYKFDTNITQFSMRRKIERLTKGISRNVPKVLFLDIETAPIKAWVWGTKKQFIPNNMIIEDWYILSWSAKWAGDPENSVKYKDQRGKSGKALRNDKKLLQPLWKLMNEADIIIGQNSDRFDLPKLNSRFLENKMGSPSQFKTIDTFKLASGKFAFTSNKLEWMTAKFCKKYKKQSHSEFAGFKLWEECIAGNKKAWASMEKYNKYDVLSLEELFLVLSEFTRTEVVTSALRAYNIIRE